MDNKIFVDSCFFKAIVDKRDYFYEDACRIIKQLMSERALLITTNYVLDESFTLIRNKCGLDYAKELKEYLANSGLSFRIIRATLNDEASAWEWFLNERGNLSFTDCISFAVMKRIGLKRTASFDKHFERAGFVLA